MRAYLALLLSLILVLTGCSPAAPAGEEQQPSQSQAQSQPEQEPEPEHEPVVSHLMVAGDVMSHMPITKDAYVAQTGEYDYSHMLQFAAQQLEGADYAVANLETVLAGGPNYSGFPAFNSPDALARDVKAAGFDLLSTANNHSRDQGLDGIYRTLDVLDQVGLAHVGTQRSQEELEENWGIHVADVGGIAVAFLSYTYGLLRDSESFFRHINLRILQCDDQLRSDQRITSEHDLRDYMEHFELIGQSATDFRPVFEHIDKLLAAGAFHHLRGMIYFTDGLGIYPKKRPKYDAAFVMLEGEAHPENVPPWGIRAVLRESEIFASQGERL